jgi:hypothetical protein
MLARLGGVPSCTSTPSLTAPLSRSARQVERHGTIGRCAFLHFHFVTAGSQLCVPWPLLPHVVSCHVEPREPREPVREGAPRDRDAAEPREPRRVRAIFMCSCFFATGTVVRTAFSSSLSASLLFVLLAALYNRPSFHAHANLPRLRFRRPIAHPVTIGVVGNLDGTVRSLPGHKQTRTRGDEETRHTSGPAQKPTISGSRGRRF